MYRRQGRARAGAEQVSRVWPTVLAGVRRTRGSRARRRHRQRHLIQEATRRDREIKHSDAKYHGKVRRARTGAARERGWRFRASAALGAAKNALASDHNDRAAQLFLNAIEISVRVKDIPAELSARKGYAMALAAQRQFAGAATALEEYLARSSASGQTDSDSVVYGLLGDIYTDLGSFDKAGEAYDKCIQVMD